MSHLYILLSDAMDAQQRGQTSSTADQLTALQKQFNLIPERTSTLGQVVSQSLMQAIAQPSREHLAHLSNALYAFEQEQNPVDYSAKKIAFKRTLTPVFELLTQAIERVNGSNIEPNIESLKQAYRQFSQTWAANERVVRNTSMGHYGAIETSLALMRVALETDPVDMTKINTHRDKLQALLDSFYRGQTLSSTASPIDFDGGVQLLRDATSATSTNNPTLAQEKLTTFIEIWPSIEGEVRTRHADLYNKVESQVPVILAHIQSPTQQANLVSLTNELAAINPNAQYSTIDAMLILLREGVEAMLIVLALIGALNAAKQPQGKKWIYAGVAAGVVASVLGAIVLQQLFPAVSAGSNREILEGVIGILAVIMMLLVGAWLHSKSSVSAWNAYIQKHMGRALSTGSLISLFGLSFLAVFREGAETIIFYAGILPKITPSAFITGVGMALAILAFLAWMMIKFSLKIPFAQLFKILTWLIYALGFKMLGISIHALQLTHIVPTTALSGAYFERPNLGIFATVQTLAAQALYVLVIIFIQHRVHQSHKKSNAPARAIDLEMGTSH